VHGALAPTEGLPCPYGSLAELRLLPPDSHGFNLSPRTAWARSFSPAADLGHASEPVRWVAGRSLSRVRPGTTPPPVGGGLTLPLLQGQPLEFAAMHVPGASQSEHDLVVHLRDPKAGPRARIQVWDGAQPLGEIDPPDDHPGFWQAPPLPFRPRGPLAQIGLILLDPDDEQARLLLRDVAIFDREVVAVGEPQPLAD
jgi:hypothetical protein